MISIHENILLKVISFHKIEIDKHISNVKSKLNSFIANPTRIENKLPVSMSLSNNQKKYLNLLKDKLTDIVTQNYSNINIYKSKFDKLISHRDKKTIEYKQFKNELLNIMGYSDLRSYFYPEFYEKLGIKSCVFCNSQLTISVNSIGGNKSAKFQVDHFLPKSEYPCFSISFFNLYPVCSSCNGKKGVKPVIFKLYSDDYNDLKNSNFSFTIVKKSLVKYRVNGDESLLQIKFLEKNNSNFDTTFDIEGIYNTQKDLAAEIITKSMIYNDSYKEMLKDSFTKLYGKDPIKFKRIIVGNYTEKHDIHKRPMAKFTQDIAKQLKLI